ncbi:MAG: hypothetical protein IJ087_10360 [Eggerthellaceae bacterium]|nr:hypothetical protein [Eggerthellaceae bacterium]
MKDNNTFHAYRCPNCCAPLTPETEACEYCGTVFKVDFRYSPAAADALEALAGIDKYISPEQLRYAARKIREEIRRKQT